MPQEGGETLGDDQGDPLGSGALTSCVVEVQGHLLVAHSHTSRVLLKHRRGIVLCERSRVDPLRDVKADQTDPSPTTV